jgi:hypothetical protein
MNFHSVRGQFVVDGRHLELPDDDSAGNTVLCVLVLFIFSVVLPIYN